MNILLKYLYEKMSEFPNSLISDENEKITYGELIEFAETHHTIFLNRKYGIVCKGVINTIKAIFWQYDFPYLSDIITAVTSENYK